MKWRTAIGAHFARDEATGNENLHVDEQAAVSILGQSGQLVHVGYDNFRILEWLDQRVGQPL